MREICPSGHEDVNVTLTNQIRDDAAHAGRHHRTRESKEDGHVVVEHRLGNIDCLVEVCRADAGRTVLVREVADGHPGTDFRVADWVVGKRLPFLLV